MKTLFSKWLKADFVKVFQSKHVFHSRHLQIRQVHDVCSQFSSGSGVEIEDENVGNHKTCFEFEVRIVLQAILFLCKVVCCKRFSFTKENL